jgi:hypothetical protein
MYRYFHRLSSAPDMGFLNIPHVIAALYGMGYAWRTVAVQSQTPGSFSLRSAVAALEETAREHGNHVKRSLFCVFHSQGLVIRYLTSTYRVAERHQLHVFKIHGITYDLTVVRQSCSICVPLGRSLYPAVSYS